MLRFTGRYTDSVSHDFNTIDYQGLENDGRTLNRRATTRTEDPEYLTMRFDAIADAYTGALEHRIMAGVEHNRDQFRFVSARGPVASIDMFDPDYGVAPIPTTRANARYDYEGRAWGFYLQDQISLGEKWKALAGLRYDTLRNVTDDIFEGEVRRQHDDAITWRAGLVYQPTTALSFYASYTQSFQPQQGRLIDGSTLDPETGEQYEVGFKSDLLADRLSLTGAIFQITKQNVQTEDPTDPDFAILTGEQRVRGIEFDLNGEILPGWNVIANAAYIKAEITRDNVFTPGNLLNGVPEWSGRVWSTYSVRDGALKGLSVAGGIRFVSARQIDLDNSFAIDGYETIDASVRYAIDDHWEVSVNAENLANTFYIEGVYSAENLYLGTPRRVTGTLRARF